MYILLSFIIIFYIFLLLCLSRFLLQSINYSVISYLGLYHCKHCDNLADFYLQENQNKTRKLIICQKCGHQIPISNFQLPQNDIPSKAECHQLAKYIIKNLLLFKNEFLGTIDSKTAIEQWESNNQNFVKKLKEYIKLYNYNETYSLQLYNTIYYKMAKRNFILNLRR